MSTPSTVFVLEDEAPVRVVLREALEAAGHTVEEFGDGHRCLQRLTESIPDLILLDIRMPRMDGYEFLDKLRANPDWRAVPVIIVSGLGDDLLRAVHTRNAERLGVVGIFAKPFDVPTLLRYVRSTLSRR
jgi:CheY-like chemotaxis protein